MSIRRRSITNYLNKFSDKGLETNKSFSKFIKPFLTNKGNLADCDIAIVDCKKVISNDFELAKTFSNHYIHAYEINSGFKPVKTTNKSKVQLSVEILSTPLSIAINNFLKYGVFADNAKITLAIPLDKGKPNKNEISNFRPVSILNTFSKIYEKVIKDQLVSVSGLDNYFSPFINTLSRRMERTT